MSRTYTDRVLDSNDVDDDDISADREDHPHARSPLANAPIARVLSILSHYNDCALLANTCTSSQRDTIAAAVPPRLSHTEMFS